MRLSLFRIHPDRHAFGLDVSDLTLRALELNRHGWRAAVRASGDVSVPPGALAEGEIREPTVVVERLQALLKALDRNLTTKNVVASLPERKTFTKVLEIPNVSDDEIQGAIRWEIEQHIPITVDDAYFDWQRLGSPPGSSSKERVLVAVAPKTIVDSYTRMLEAAGLRPYVFETESAAIIRSALPAAEAAGTDGTMVVDLGASRTGIIMVNHGAIEFTSTVGVSGREMTSLIAKRQQLPLAKAEAAKLLYGLDPKKGRGAIREILEPVIADLGRKISETMSYYQDHFSGTATFRRILLTGGVAQMHGLPDLLAESVTLPIVRANPWSNLRLSRSLPERFPNLSYTTAIGLAMRGMTRGRR